MIVNRSIEQFVEDNIILNVSNFIAMIDNYNLPCLFPNESEQWVVSEYLGRQLKSKGEIVIEFAGYTIWQRNTSGQRIAMDKVIKTIYGELNHE